MWSQSLLERRSFKTQEEDAPSIFHGVAFVWWIFIHPSVCVEYNHMRPFFVCSRSPKFATLLSCWLVLLDYQDHWPPQRNRYIKVIQYPIPIKLKSQFLYESLAEYWPIMQHHGYWRKCHALVNSDRGSAHKSLLIKIRAQINTVRDGAGSLVCNMHVYCMTVDCQVLCIVL